MNPQITTRWFKRFSMVLLIVAVVSGIIGCGGKSGLNIPPPIPSDDQDIPEPQNRRINNYADGFDKQISNPLWRALDLSRQFRKLAGNKKEAFNVNAFDGVVNSSWFTNRNGTSPMTIEEVERGPDMGDGPLMDQPMTIIDAKTEGVTPGFTIKDARGGRFIIKFDPKGWNELSTGAEVVSTKLMYAAGYHTPENYIAFLDPSLLVVGDVTVLDRKIGAERPMTLEDIDTLLTRVHIRSDGTIRVAASKFLPGKPIGPFKYHGTRKDDPNDFIPHEHRRELRGLWTIAGWINHWDTKAGNSLDIYVNDDGRRYVRHYLIDFGSTLGSQGDEPMPLWVGHENSSDPGQMVKNTVGLGLYVPSWWKDRGVKYTSIGVFDARDFEPRGFKTIIPNPAFVNQTDRDGFWGARIVTSFTDAQIRAAVAAGQYSDPEAADYLVGVLIERRDIIGRFWFDRMNPVDQFSVQRASGGWELTGVDLAAKMGYIDPADVRYQYQLLRDGNEIGAEGETGMPIRIPLPNSDDGILEVRVRNGKQDGGWGRWVSAFLQRAGDGEGYTIVAVQRQD